MADEASEEDDSELATDCTVYDEVYGASQSHGYVADVGQVSTVNDNVGQVRKDLHDRPEAVR